MLKGRLNFILAVSVLVGTIVGAGIFALPYSISQSGLFFGFFYFIILGIAVLFIHLFCCEIILRTKDGYGLVGVAQKYLGGWGKNLFILSVLIVTIGALLAYLILIGDFLSLLFSSFVSVSPAWFTVIFWVFSIFFVLRGIKMIGPLEIFSNLLFFLAITVIFIFAIPKVNLDNFVIFKMSKDAFLPYGIILFSLLGWSALSEVVRVLHTSEEKRSVSKVVIVSTVSVIIFYLLFVVSIIGVAGSDVSPDTVTGLVSHLDGRIIFLVILAGVITLVDSFLIIALYLKNTFIYDFKLGNLLSSSLVLAVPMILYLIGLRSFIGVIGFVGTIVGVIQGTIIILIFKRIKMKGDRDPEYSLNPPKFVYFFLILIFILGAVVQLLFL